MAEITLKVRIDLAAMRDIALRRLQRLMDVLFFTRAASNAMTSEQFTEHVEFFRLSPSQNTALPFEGARTEAELWTRLHCLRDGIDVVGAFLEETKRACDMYRLIKHPNLTVGDLQAVERRCSAFHSLGLPKKIELLKREFGVQSDFDEHVISLNEARNCLVHRLGLVSERETKGSDAFSIRWMEICVRAESPDGTEVAYVEQPSIFAEGWQVAVTLRPVEKSYRLGESIELSYRELLGTVFSHQNFVNNLTASAEGYAKTLGFQFIPAC